VLQCIIWILAHGSKRKVQLHVSINIQTSSIFVNNTENVSRKACS
jgi:hypothetical protein